MTYRGHAVVPGAKISVKERVKYEAKYKRFRKRFRWYLFLTEYDSLIGIVGILLMIFSGIALWLGVITPAYLDTELMRSAVGDAYVLWGQRLSVSGTLMVGFILYDAVLILGGLFGIMFLHHRYAYRVLRDTVRRLPADKSDMSFLKSEYDGFHRMRMDRLEKERYLEGW